MACGWHNSKPTTNQQATSKPAGGGGRVAQPISTTTARSQQQATASQQRVGTAAACNAESQTRLRDVLPQDLGLHGLRVPEVHGFIEELVDDDEVIPD